MLKSNRRPALIVGGHLSASIRVGVLQGQMGRCVDGYAVGQCHITPLVRVVCPRVPPAGVLAWQGELAPHAS
jgi:hypothetical protein